VLDAPYYPLEKGDSRRSLLLILGFLAGIFTTLSLLIARAYMDERLKSPDSVREATGLEVGGVLPNFSLIKGSGKHAASAKQSLALLLQQVKVETLGKAENPKMVFIGSTREGEGKTLISTQVVAGLRAGNSRVLHLYPYQDGLEDAHPDNHSYRVNPELTNKTAIEQLIWENPGGEAGLADFNFIVLESPDMLSGQYPLGLVGQFDLILLTCRANRSWEAADQQAVATLEKASDAPIRVILNGVTKDVLKDYLGGMGHSNYRKGSTEGDEMIAYPVLADR